MPGVIETNCSDYSLLYLNPTLDTEYKLLTVSYTHWVWIARPQGESDRPSTLCFVKKLLFIFPAKCFIIKKWNLIEIFMWLLVEVNNSFQWTLIVKSFMIFKAHPVSDYLPHLLKIQNFILRGFRRKLGNVILQISVNQKRYFYCFSLTITLNIGKFYTNKTGT